VSAVKARQKPTRNGIIWAVLLADLGSTQQLRRSPDQEVDFHEDDHPEHLQPLVDSSAARPQINAVPRLHSHWPVLIWQGPEHVRVGY
jgi:hypothetical protein